MRTHYETARSWKYKPYMGKKHPGVPGIRRGFSKIKQELLYELIKNKILERISDHLNLNPVRAEWYANEFRVPIHRITQIFMRLNHDGLMSRRKNHKTDLPWNASYYHVRSIKPAGQLASAVSSTA